MTEKKGLFLVNFRPSSRAQSAVETIIVLAIGLFILTYLTAIVYNQVENSTISQHVEQGRVVAQSLANAVNDAYFLGPGTVKNLAINLPEGVDFSKSSIEGREIILNISGREVIVPTKVDVRGVWPSEGQGVFVITVFNDFVAISSQPLLFSPAQINREMLQGTSFDTNLIITSVGLDNSSYGFNISLNSTGVTASTTSTSPLIIASGGEALMPLHISCPSDSYGSYSGAINFYPSDLSDANLSVPLNITCSPSQSSVVILPSRKTFSVLGSTTSNQSLLICNNSSNSYVINSPTISGAISSFAFTSFSGTLSANTCVDLNLLVKAPAYGSVNNYPGAITATVGDFTASADLNMIVTSGAQSFYSFFSVGQNNINPNNTSSLYVYKNSDLNAYLATGELDWNTSDTGREAYFDGRESYFDGNELQNTSSLWDSNLVALWHLNDKNSQDYILNSKNEIRDGSLLGGAVLSTDGLWDTNSVSFNGSTAYVSIPNGYTNLMRGVVKNTVSFWFKGNSFSNSPVLFGAFQATVGDYAIQTNATGTALYWAVRPANTTYRNYTGINFSNGWHHVVAVKTDTGDTGNLYLDGVLLTTYTGVLQTTPSLTSPLVIGKYAGSATYFFNGAIEEVAIWNRALTTTEVYTLYSSQAGKYVKPNLVGLWHLNDKNSSGFVLNSVTNVRDANVNGGADTNAVGLWDSNAGWFNGTNGFVDGGKNVVKSTSGTFSAWIYPRSIASQNNIVMYTDMNSNENLIQLVTDGTTGKLRAQVYFGTQFVYTINNFTGPVIPINTWSHVVVTANGTSYALYVNGISQTLTFLNGSNTGVWSSSLNGTLNTYIGKFDRLLGPGSYFNGSIEEVGIWNRALTATEISSIYSSQVGKFIKPNLLGLWHLNDKNAQGFVLNSATNLRDGNLIRGADVNSSGLWNTSSAWIDNNSAIDLGDSFDSFTTGANARFTISIWAKPTAIMTNSPILIKNGDSTCSVSENQRQYGLRLYTGSKPEFLWYGDLLGNSYRGVLGSTSINNLNSWHHIVVTYDGTNATVNNRVSIYVNGLPDSTSIDLTSGSPTAIPDGNARIGIGKSICSTGLINYNNLFFSGSIEEPIIWNRVLSATEINSIYQAQKGNWFDANLVAYYKFNTKNGTTVYDSARAFNGTLYNSADVLSGGLWDNNLLRVNGSPQYVDLGSAIPIINQSAITVTAWFNPKTLTAGTNGWSPIFSKRQSDSAYLPTIELVLGDSDASLYPDQLFARINTGSDAYAYTARILKPGNWYHVAMQYEGSGATNSEKLKIYLNGSQLPLTFSGTIPSTTSAPAGNIRVGGMLFSSQPRYFNGSIDELKFYNRALSYSEIQTDYNRFLLAKLVDSNIVDANATADWNNLRINKTNGYSFGKEIEDWNKLKLMGINELGSSPDASYLYNDANLVGLWHLNDKNSAGFVLNSVTGVRDGNLIGGADTNAVGLWDTNTVSFNGSSQYVNVLTKFPSVRTISFWMKPNAATNYPLRLSSNKSVISAYGLFSGEPSTRYVNGTLASETLGSSLISNSSFSTDLTGWAAGNGASAVRDTSTYNSSAASVKITYNSAGTGDFYASTRFSITSGTLYKISFWAKSSVPKNMGITAAEWTTFVGINLSQNFQSTTSWKKYEMYGYASLTSSNAYISFTGDNGGSTFDLWVDDITVTPVSSDVSTTSLNQWNHYVIVSNYSFDANAVALGYSLGGYLNGQLDEVAIWNRPLSASEISDLYNSQKPMYQNGLVGLWHLNDKNSSGWLMNSVTSQRDSNLNGVSDINASGLWDTNAAWFNGVNGGIKTPILNLGNKYAISFWMKPNVLYDYGDPLGAGSADYYLSFVTYADGHMVYNVGTGSAWGTAATVPAATLSANKWFYVVGVSDGTTIKLYLNGILINSASNSNTVNNFINIGRRTSANLYPFNGSIDEVAIWNRALSASEVKELYRKGVSKLDLNIYSCSDATCATRTGSQYISDANNGSWMDLNSSLPNSQYLGMDAYFKPGKNFTDQNAGTFWIGSYLKDFNVLYTK